MDKYVSLNSYKAGRSCLLAVTGLTLLNVLLQLIGSNVSFLYSAILPQIAVAIASEIGGGMQSYLIVFVFAIIPLILFAICYILSKKDWKWLMVGTILIVVDFVCLIIFTMLVGILDFILNYVFSIVIIVTMFKATKAGKQLGNDFEMPDIDEAIKEDIDIGENGVKIYHYDKQLDKQNSISKMWQFLLVTLGIFIIEVGAVILIASLAGRFGETITAIIGVVVATSIIALYIVYSVKVMPFINPSAYSFYKENDIVYRLSYDSISTIQMFANLLVEKETDKAYYCSYINKNGKSKKVIIPKCYPQIDEILY